MNSFLNPHHTRAAMRQRGVTLVELMVGMLIGLLAVIVISQVLLISEGQKRTTTSGSDAQVNGALALYALQRDIEMAGYGITSSPGVIGCEVKARYEGTPAAGFPVRLAPVVITKESDRPLGSVGGDAIRVLSSSKTSFSVPTRVVPPAYIAGGLAFPVTASLGMKQGDLALVGIDSTNDCGVFQITSNPTGESVPRVNNATWNDNGYPNLAYPDGSVLINLGTVVDNTYQIVGTSLQQQSFVLTTNTRPIRDVQPDIVTMRALYGKDDDGDGDVDGYDAVTPVTNADWLKVIAIRLVVVARSEQFEKDEVTPAALQWDVGTTPATAGAVACGAASECLTLSLVHVPDWKHYRYKQFETVIPLRNMLWKS